MKRTSTIPLIGTLTVVLTLAVVAVFLLPPGIDWNTSVREAPVSQDPRLFSEHSEVAIEWWKFTDNFSEDREAWNPEYESDVKDVEVSRWSHVKAWLRER